MINLVEGNLLSFSEEAIAHGCNCLGFMGGGIALSIAETWPSSMLEQYQAECSKKFLHELLGNLQVIKETGLPILFNLFTQPYPGPTASLPAIASSLKAMAEYCVENQIKSVGLPMIGAGIGGLNEFEVMDVFVRTLTNYNDITFVIYKKYNPNQPENLILAKVH